MHRWIYHQGSQHRHRRSAEGRHLKSPDFLDVEKYPEIRFKGTVKERTLANSYTLVGELTMHGVTKPSPLSLTYLGTSLRQSQQAAKGRLKVNGVINRTNSVFPTMPPAFRSADDWQGNPPGCQR
ncbi:MAG: YceI family protein [Saprospiraceae bacterium]|nr:YceI family protein [Saprospiraceae bacterium]